MAVPGLGAVDRGDIGAAVDGIMALPAAAGDDAPSCPLPDWEQPGNATEASTDIINTNQRLRDLLMGPSPYELESAVWQ